MSTTEGFSRRASGLFVPPELKRDRQVWSKDEYKLLDRVTKMAGGHGIKVLLECQEPGCKGKPIARLRRPDGGITLQCEHMNREVWKL